MRLRRTLHAAGLAALASTWASLGHAMAFTNGDFEAGSLAPWAIIYPIAGDGAGHLPSEVVDISSLPDDVHDGLFGLGIRNPGWIGPAGGMIGVVGMVSQDFDTVAGQTYQLSYWLKILGLTGTNLGLAAWGDANAGCNWAAIVPSNSTGSPCGVVPGSWTLNPNQSGWVQYSFQVVATSDRSTIVLAGRSDFSRVSFDDVTVTPVSTVPEPSPLLLLATGAAVFAARRKLGRSGLTQ